MKFKNQKEFEATLKAIGDIAKVEITKALVPLQNRVATLEAENAALKDAIRQMRERQALSDITPAAVADRYRSLS